MSLRRAFLDLNFGARRIGAGALLGIAVGFAAHDVLRLPFRIAAGWIVAVALYLFLTGLALDGAKPDDVRRHDQQAENDPAPRVLLPRVAAAVSLLALGASFGK